MNVIRILEECDSSGYVVRDITNQKGARKILLMPPDSDAAARRKVYRFKSQGQQTILVGVVDNRYQAYVCNQSGDTFEVRLT